MNISIFPGNAFLDTEGKRIQAHGGSIFYDADEKTYYLYGENKEYSIRGSGIWTWGIRAYSSKDFYNWKDCGLIIEPVLDVCDSPLNPRTAKLDRPHILYNSLTKKYVCWMKVMESDGRQTITIAAADRFLGPYMIIRSGFQPFGMNAGDFDLAQDSDGKAYYYFEHVHSELICTELNGDYTDVTENYSAHFQKPYPPFVREAPAHFKRGGMHYLITSGTTGYFPNRSEVAVADTWYGPFSVLCDPHPDDKTGTSFHTQISSVFKVPGKKDLYIALADRWLPQAMNVPAAYSEELLEGLFSEKVPLKEAAAFRNELIRKYDLQALRDVLENSDSNTAISDYVWLPLRFEEATKLYPQGRVIIDWLDEWRLEDYE